MTAHYTNRMFTASRLLVCACIGLPAACGSGQGDAPTSIADAWDVVQVSPARPVAGQAEISVGGVNGGDETGESSDPPIATVNGRPIARHRVVDLALRAHGPGILEQLIVLDTAERVVVAKGLDVSQSDLDHEYDRMLRSLTDPFATSTSAPLDRERAERVLARVLSDRNISRSEFLLGVRRNAYLRKIVESELELGEAELGAEIQRLSGRRVQVRHIQTATLAEVTRVQDRLAAGEDFAGVAARYTANLAGARSGGLLDPFSEHDDQVPGALRKAAFNLKSGEVSDTIRVGEWYHLLKVERFLPPGDVDRATLRRRAAHQLRERLTGPATRELYERFLGEADIRIHDPLLRESFEAKHPRPAH